VEDIEKVQKTKNNERDKRQEKMRAGLVIKATKGDEIKAQHCFDY
jgi:hypothetical protein